MVMDEEWEFMADGSGYRRIKGPFGQIRAEVRFEWRSVGEHTIESRVVAAFEDGVARDVDDDERDWRVTRYDFRTFPTDTGTEVAMVERTQGGDALRGFGDGMIPLAFRGPPDS